MGPPIYRTGIGMSRMRDDETEESARIKALCPGLTTHTQKHLASEPGTR